HDRKETVGNDEQVSIGQDRRHDIGQDDFQTVGRNHTIRTGKDRTEEVGNHRRDKTVANHWVSIGGHQEHTVEGHSELQAGQAIRQRTKVYEIQAAESLSIKGPGGTISIDGSGITLNGIAIAVKGPMRKSGGGGGNSLSLVGEVLEGLEADCVERNR
ncbi:type VI secretion system tip protein VgrG, partial [Salmonella enterica subsp. enterica serovar Eastbourne]|nr:type VI secretion system tip protein VgrG [Salmonella enterica subsp. enterica serovar Eastbourne]EHC5910277.1 type VI secretion system tip protein VgrG [Salmonella enterica subsp. enterica serovar Eastbourne]